ncbi:MAG: Tim44 domain-containing protein [Alphaproteobacteria bacterium]|nr:Tim44 domain-containing protein [Alphaproteobacteria bacterium]
MAFLDLILLAAIAGFLGYRLWAVLGTHDAEKPIRKRKSIEDDSVIPIRARSAPSPKSQDAKKTEDEKEEPTLMEEDRFLQGASIAFHKIVEAYAAGDKHVLEKLLEGPLLETFEDAIEKRETSKKKLEVDIARVVTAEIIDNREEKGKVYITVRFISEQCLVTKNAKGKVLEGDPDQYITVTDIWTFARSLKNTDPNWKLVATQVPEA